MMINSGVTASALSYLPNWLRETIDPQGFDGLLAGWSKACGWRAAGFVGAGGIDSLIVKLVLQAGSVEGAAPNPEISEVTARIRSGEQYVYWPTSGSCGRVYAGVWLAGRPISLLWAERSAGQPWTEAEKTYVGLTAKLVERSPSISQVLGPVIDSDRLAQRLADASVIAGRIAHDFDNILTGIIGFSDLSIPLLPPGSQGAGYIAEVSKVGQRGILFTQQLHQLSRSGHTRPMPGAAATAIAREEIRMRSTIAPAGVRIEKHFTPNLPPVAVEGGTLQMVLGHLLANAVEASSPGGTVKVTARPVELSDADAREYLGKVGVGAYLEIEFSDAGSGIKPEVRRRLFAEPFFTTKVRHRGLGLAVAYRVLCAHRGGIQIDPVPPPGTGTRARVVLPLAAARPSAVTGTITATTVGG